MLPRQFVGRKSSGEIIKSVHNASNGGLDCHLQTSLKYLIEFDSIIRTYLNLFSN